MPEFASRLVEWFQACSTAQKVLIVIGALVILALVSPATVLIASVALLISLVVLVLRAVRRGSLRVPVILAGVSLVAVLLFSGISATLYGSDTALDTTEVQKAAEESVAEEPEPAPEPAEPRKPEPGLEPIEVPDSVDYQVVVQDSDDERGLSVRTWGIETEDDSPGALCAIAQDAALDAGEGWDAVRVVSDGGVAYVRMSNAAPDYSNTEGFKECPGPGEIFATR